MPPPDDVRGFVKGDSGTVRMLAQRALGSPDIFGQAPGQYFPSIKGVVSGAAVFLGFWRIAEGKNSRLGNR